jgi:hypothetical protein
MVKRLKIPKELPEAVFPRRTDNTMVKRLKIPKELPEAVIPRRTDNTMVKRLKIPKELLILFGLFLLACPSWNYGFW